MKMTDNYGHWDISMFGNFDPADFWGFIYEIEEIATGRCYIGKKQFRFKRKKSKSNPSRTKESDWKDYTSSCIPLQESIETQGKDKFVFRILSLCAGKSQMTYEECQLQYTRDVLRSKLPNGERKYWNKTIGHLLFAGVEKQTAEAKAKISAARMGTQHSEETKARMSASQRGKIITDGQRLLISIAKMGHTVSEETRIKIGKANRGNKAHFGCKHTEATKTMLSLLRTSQKGTKRGPYKNKRRFYKAKNVNLPL